MPGPRARVRSPFHGLEQITFGCAGSETRFLGETGFLARNTQTKTAIAAGYLVKSALAGFPGRCVLLPDACHSGAVDEERRRAATRCGLILISLALLVGAGRPTGMAARCAPVNEAVSGGSKTRVAFTPPAA